MSNLTSSLQSSQKPVVLPWLIRFFFGWFEMLILISTMGKLRES